MKIVERFREGTKHVVRIANADETRSMFLSFPIAPSDVEVRAAFQSALDAEQVRRQEQDDEQTDTTTLQDAIAKYEAGQLTNAQSRLLLDKLIARLRKHGIL